MSFRNRCILAGAAGPITLSVPLLSGRDQRAKTGEVRISYDLPWQNQHWKTITSLYRKAPFFEFYEEGLHALLFKKYDMLADLDEATFRWVSGRLKWEGAVDRTEKYRDAYDALAIIDLRNRFLPKNYTQWVGAPYPQVFEERTGFLPNLSILDLLFCCGPSSAAYLRSGAE